MMQKLISWYAFFRWLSIFIDKCKTIQIMRFHHLVWTACLICGFGTLSWVFSDDESSYSLKAKSLFILFHVFVAVYFNLPTTEIVKKLELTEVWQLDPTPITDLLTLRRLSCIVNDDDRPYDNNTWLAKFSFTVLYFVTVEFFYARIQNVTWDAYGNMIEGAIYSNN